MVNKNLFILVLIIILIAFGAVLISNKGKISDLLSKKLDQDDVAKLPVDSKPNDYYKPDVPKDAVITTPSSEDSASTNVNSEEKFRTFNLSINQNGYNPQTIVVNKDDIIEIRMEALDGNYAFNLPALGIYKLVKKGEKNKVGFGVRTTGTFIFDCKDYCPPNKKISGSLIVLP